MWQDLGWQLIPGPHGVKRATVAPIHILELNLVLCISKCPLPFQKIRKLEELSFFSWISEKCLYSRCLSWKFWQRKNFILSWITMVWFFRRYWRLKSYRWKVFFLVLILRFFSTVKLLQNVSFGTNFLVESFDSFFGCDGLLFSDFVTVSSSLSINSFFGI